jgi:hypothetical protein
MFFKPVDVIGSPQSPLWGLPFLIALGNDSAARLQRVFEDIRLAAAIREVLATSFPLRPDHSAMTRLMLAFIGDFAACQSITNLPAANRPFPGRIGDAQR